MAPPVITVEVNPTSVPASGGQVQVKIHAHDPDVGQPSKVFRGSATAKSTDGEEVAIEFAITTREGVPGDTIVSYGLTATDPDVQIVQNPSDPSLFTVTIPAVE